MRVGKLGAVCVLALGVLGSERAFSLAWAESTAAEVAEPTTAPGTDQVLSMIGNLASVRDYERLYWILHAIEQQAAPTRADLLARLDARVQELLQGVASTVVVNATTTTDVTPDQPTTPHASQDMAAASQRLKERVEERLAQRPMTEVSTREEVDQALTKLEDRGDTEGWMKELFDASRKIQRVEDKADRAALRARLDQLRRGRLQASTRSQDLSKHLP